MQIAALPTLYLLIMTQILGRRLARGCRRLVGAVAFVEVLLCSFIVFPVLVSRIHEPGRCLRRLPNGLLPGFLLDRSEMSSWKYD